MPEDVEIDRAIQNVSDALAALDAPKPTPGKTVKAVTVPGKAASVPAADATHESEVRDLAIAIRRGLLYICKDIEQRYNLKDEKGNRAA